MVAQPGSSNGPLLAQAFSFQLDAMGVVDEPVQDGVGQGRVADDVVPAVDWHLAGDDQRPGIVAIFDDLQQVALLLGDQRLGFPAARGQQFVQRLEAGKAGQRGEQPFADIADLIFDLAFLPT